MLSTILHFLVLFMLVSTALGVAFAMAWEQCWRFYPGDDE